MRETPMGEVARRVVSMWKEMALLIRLDFWLMISLFESLSTLTINSNNILF